MVYGAAHSYTVSEITREIRSTLEGEFPQVQVEGELSNVRVSGAGHIYFSLKDEGAVLDAVMFRGRATRLEFEPADGTQVTARGSISVYERRGKYQLVCEQMIASGIGRILQMLEERKRRLAEEGLFAQERKRELPMFPRRVAVVTSSSGAALRDILNVLKRRSSGIDVVVIPTLVQGDEAPPQIARGIELACRFRLGDVVIVGRGGGSLEDLLPFSDEQVVRAIAAADLPVISAVGHETDTSLSDLAADVRAPTPSAAAEIVSASREELLGRVLNAGRSIVRSFLERRERLRLALRRFSPDELERSVRYLLQPRQQRVDDAREAIVEGMRTRHVAASHRVTLAREALEARNPFDVVKRGYAIVRRAGDRAILTDAAHVRATDRLAIQMRDGDVAARPETTAPGDAAPQGAAPGDAAGETGATPPDPE